MRTPTGTSTPAAPYAQSAGGLGAFTYTPVIVRLFARSRSLPWYSFLWLWTGVLVATLIWLGWRSSLVVLAFPPVALELYHGNVHLLIAAAIVLGFRWPATWAFVILTKVTPGVGLIWFARPARMAKAGDRPGRDRPPWSPSRCSSTRRSGAPG